MRTLIKKQLPMPRVLLVGDFEHPDFGEAVAALRADAELSLEGGERGSPELMVIAQSRPGVVDGRSIEPLRRAAPLAGVVSLLGSWCEGRVRVSRPVHDSLRLYWHEFLPWWRRQLALRSAGRCPDWARPDCLGFQTPRVREPRPASSGTIVLSTPHWETADVLADVLRREGYATVWQRPGRAAATVRGVTAGIWEGGQLDDREAEELTAFCQSLAADEARVVVLLDFPRRDRCQAAREAGAAAVLGKPWVNADLVASLDDSPRLCRGY